MRWCVRRRQRSVEAACSLLIDVVGCCCRWAEWKRRIHRPIYNFSVSLFWVVLMRTAATSTGMTVSCFSFAAIILRYLFLVFAQQELVAASIFRLAAQKSRQAES